LHPNYLHPHSGFEKTPDELKKWKCKYLNFIDIQKNNGKYCSNCRSPQRGKIDLV